MGSLSSRPLSDALEDIVHHLHNQGHRQEPLQSSPPYYGASGLGAYTDKEEDDDLDLVDDFHDSGCMSLKDPRSPSCDIVRTPIQAAAVKPQFLREKRSDLFPLFDPRSPGVPRTPIYPDPEIEDEFEEEIDTDHAHGSLLDTTPTMPPPSYASTPLIHSSSVEELQRSLSDSNIAEESDEKLLIRSDPVLTPVSSRNRAVSKIRLSMRRAKNLVTKQKPTEHSSQSSPKLGLRNVDVNSPLAFIKNRQITKIDGMKRRHSMPSPYKIESNDKENLPYS